MSHKLKSLLTYPALLNWLPRIASLASFVIIGMFLFGGNEPWKPLTTNESIGFMCFPVGVLFGLLVAWIRPMSGGLLSIVSLISFYVWHFATAGSIPRGPWFIIFSSPAFLFLVCGFLSRKVLKDERPDR